MAKSNGPVKDESELKIREVVCGGRGEGVLPRHIYEYPVVLFQMICLLRS